MSLESYEELLNQVQQLRDRCAELEHDLDFAYKRSKVLADMLSIPVHESPEVTGTILGLVRGKVERMIEEKSKPIPLKDKFTAGLQFQVAKINELEKQLQDNHDRAEEIIAGREKQIHLLQEEIKELRFRMPSALTFDFCANSELHLELAKREAATKCIEILSTAIICTDTEFVRKGATQFQGYAISKIKETFGLEI